MIIANPADRGHASWASDEAWHWALALRLEHMGVGLWQGGGGLGGGCRDCRPPGHSLNIAGGGRFWSSYAVALMAFGWDPLCALPAMQLMTGQGGPRVKETQAGSHQLVPKSHGNLPSQQQRNSPGLLFILWYNKLYTVLCGSVLFVWFLRAASPRPPLLHNSDTTCVSDEQLKLGFPKAYEHCEHLSAPVGLLV